MALSKVTIFSYPDRRMEGKEKEFILPVNPESYSKNFKIEYDNTQAHGTHGTSGRFNSSAPEQLKLDFILDGTNTIQGYRYGSLPSSEPTDDPSRLKTDAPKDDIVEKQLNEFLETVYDLDGEIHRNRFLKIFWGIRIFRCVVSNIDINYNLFHPNGKPLRVKISATFTDYIAQEQREQRAKRKSPDLTRIRQIKAGDRLDKMVNEFYNDPKFITQIARVNSLTTFRTIKPGIELAFPPLDKTEDA